MEHMPEVSVFGDGSKAWEEEFKSFSVVTYIPKNDLPGDIVNFGFRAPYLMIFPLERLSKEEAKEFADDNGFSDIARQFAGSVNFFYPVIGDTDEPYSNPWEAADPNMYVDIMSQSRISQYYQDGMAIMYDRFAKKMGNPYIRGAVLRTYLYGWEKSADFIARNCLKTIEGDGLYGKGDITPACCILEALNYIPPKPERRDIPVLSIGNDHDINDALKASLDHVMTADFGHEVEDFKNFVGTFRRMMGYLAKEDDLEKMGMACEPDFVTVKTSQDNRGDDKDTTNHRIGYVAYYNKGIMDNGKKAPLLMCFHGGGDSAFCMASVSGWYKVAAKYGFLLVCVENHLNSTATETIEMIEKLKEKYSIDETRIYASGFSMGGCKSWDMMQEYPKTYAAVAPMDATFEVGLNSYGQPIGEYNQDVIVPVFYAGGELTPLPELPFQAQKCLDRMKYVFQVNQLDRACDVQMEDKDNWSNKIWGIDGDHTVRLVDESRDNAVLTLQLFTSNKDKCYAIFGSISNQGHEVRHHTCEQAWKFMSQFQRLGDGTLTGGDMDKIKALY